MFELDLEMIAKLRERRARKNITLAEAANEIGISVKTLGMIEGENRLIVKKTVYTKLIDWLVNEKKYEESEVC
ncbi:helix-turn-helix transcriptional regulator [uncultured Enterococcus sp.]|uniref:helix-turn-helix domain-containing protein n=1 Tax=uncultured Enterococcus sp. TaxID=167972 RepID=UPI002AA92625|nr:helix-turn-helix transcriptional regulator [uncultured Enterococcus sp.]